MIYYTKPRSATQAQIFAEMYRVSDDHTLVEQLVLGQWLRRDLRIKDEIPNQVAAGLLLENPAFEKSCLSDPTMASHPMVQTHIAVDEDWVQADDNNDPLIVDAIAVGRHGPMTNTWYSVEQLLLRVDHDALILAEPPVLETFSSDKASMKRWREIVNEAEKLDAGKRNFVWNPKDGGRRDELVEFLHRQRGHVQRTQKMRTKQFEQGTADYDGMSTEDFAKAFQQSLKAKR